MPVVADDDEDEQIGVVDGILLHPDTGAVEGFFVHTGGMFLPTDTLFLSVSDILQWGMVLRVRDAERLAKPEEVIRVAERLHDPRRILGQKILLGEERRVIGRCRDVQFSTGLFSLEWLFPKKFFFAGKPIPVSAIVEVTEEGILVREPEATVPDDDRKKAPAEEYLREPLPTPT